MVFGFLFRKKEEKVKKRKITKPSLKRPQKESGGKKNIKKTAKKTKEVLIGKITHFFPQVSAGVIKLKASLSLGDTIHIKGHTSDFIQKVTSLQINNKPVKRASKGKLVGFLSKERVRRKDKVYKVKEK